MAAKLLNYNAPKKKAAPTDKRTDELRISRMLKRFDKAKRVKMEWRDIYSDAYEYALPQRNLYYSSGTGDQLNVTQGQKKVSRVFDSTAPNATINFANSIQSDLMPPFQKWIKLAAGPMVPPALVAEVNRKLEYVTDQMFAVLQASNFDVANNEVLLDLAIGTGCMLVLEGPLDKPVLYIPVPAPLVALEEGPWGSVEGMYRDYTQFPARHITQQWPDAKIPEELQRLINDPNNLELKVDLAECTYWEPDEKQWVYEVIWGKEKKCMVYRYYKTCPWLTPRWIKVAGETYGRGPVIHALPDIKTINKITELILKNAAIHISGVYTGVDDGVLNPNTVAIAPGVIIPVASNGGARGPSLMALQRTGDFTLATLEHDKLQLQIKQMLFDNQLPPETGKVRSATEIIERVKELARNIGSPFGRLLVEYIQPLVQRTLEIMEKRGLCEKVKVDGLGVQVQVISPLAQQQNLSEVEAVVRWLSIVGAYGQEMLILSAKLEDIGTWIGHKLGVPSSLLRTTDERTALQTLAAQLVKTQMAKTIGANGQPAANDTGGLGTGVPAPQIGIAGQAAGLDLAA